VDRPAARAASIVIGEAHRLATLVIEHGTAGQGDVHLWFSSSAHAGNRQLHHVVLVARLAQELLCSERSPCRAVSIGAAMGGLRVLRR
jgi:hypothetical protein